MKDTLQQYRDLREALRREKEQLENRLREITIALGETPSSGPAQSAPRGRGRRGGGSGGRSLKDLVLEVTSRRPLSKQEILDEVQRLGYKFESKNPANSLGVILYGKNPRFINEGGRFRFSGAASAPAAKASGKRTMSAEARARIRAAALARWQKAKASGKKRL
jgi:hypothetical protein